MRTHPMSLLSKSSSVNPASNGLAPPKNPELNRQCQGNDSNKEVWAHSTGSPIHANDTLRLPSEHQMNSNYLISVGGHSRESPFKNSAGSEVLAARQDHTLPSHQHARGASKTAPCLPTSMPEVQHLPSACTCKQHPPCLASLPISMPEEWCLASACARKQPPPCLASRALKRHNSPSLTTAQSPALHKVGTPSFYFERQTGMNCQAHALNNLMGFRLISPEMLKAFIAHKMSTAPDYATREAWRFSAYNEVAAQGPLSGFGNDIVQTWLEETQNLTPVKIANVLETLDDKVHALNAEATKRQTRPPPS